MEGAAECVAGDEGHALAEADPQPSDAGEGLRVPPAMTANKKSALTLGAAAEVREEVRS